METFFSHIIREVCKRRESTPSGSKVFPLIVVPILKREVIENHESPSMPIHVLQYVIHAQKRPCTHLSFGAYVQKRRVILCMHNQ